MQAMSKNDAIAAVAADEAVAAYQKQMCNWMDVINERAVALRDKIGTGELMAPLRAEVQDIINLSREYLR